MSEALLAEEANRYLTRSKQTGPRSKMHQFLHSNFDEIRADSEGITSGTLQKILEFNVVPVFLFVSFLVSSSFFRSSDACPQVVA